MSLQAATVAAVTAGARGHRLPVHLAERPSRAWFAAWCGLHGAEVEPGAEWDLLARVPAPAAYAAVLGGTGARDGIVAVGRTVVDGGWAGVFGMATVPAARRSGAATAVLGALADWAADRGAEGLYLQVERDNRPARRLYAAAGFTPVAAYHYRSRPAPETRVLR
jgi:GNAT superfamily N-acetyltransferase